MPMVMMKSHLHAIISSNLSFALMISSMSTVFPASLWLSSSISLATVILMDWKLYHRYGMDLRPVINERCNERGLATTKPTVLLKYLIIVMYAHNVHNVHLAFAMQNKLYIRWIIIPNYWLWNNFGKLSKACLTHDWFRGFQHILWLLFHIFKYTKIHLLLDLLRLRCPSIFRSIINVSQITVSSWRSSGRLQLWVFLKGSH